MKCQPGSSSEQRLFGSPGADPAYYKDQGLKNPGTKRTDFDEIGSWYTAKARAAEQGH